MCVFDGAWASAATMADTQTSQSVGRERAVLWDQAGANLMLEDFLLKFFTTAGVVQRHGHRVRPIQVEVCDLSPLREDLQKLCPPKL